MVGLVDVTLENTVKTDMLMQGRCQLSTVRSVLQAYPFIGSDLNILLLSFRSL